MLRLYKYFLFSFLRVTHINSTTVAKKRQTIIIEINLIKKLNIPINTEKVFVFVIYNSSMTPVYNFTQSKYTTFQANTNLSIPIQASDSSMLFIRFIQFKEGDRSVVHSNSIYGHLVCKQRFTGVSSVCSIGSSKPITTAVPSTYMTFSL